MANVAVLGAGTMGHALALVFALGGHRVRLTDSAPATLERAQGLMETALATLVRLGEVPPERTADWLAGAVTRQDRKSTRLNSSHANISYAVFCLKKKKVNPMSKA